MASMERRRMMKLWELEEILMTMDSEFTIRV